MSDDDVIDYLVAEAVGLKVAHEDAEAAKEAQRAEWKQQHNALRERLTH